MKISIIGPGVIANKFAKACKRVSEIELYAVASRNYDKAKVFAKEYDIQKVYGNYDELLANHDIDAVYVSVINTAHYDIVKKCILADKAVICEKPMCMNCMQTEELIALAKERKVLLMEGMWTQFLPCIKQVKQWICSGKIGNVKYIQTSFAFCGSDNATGRLLNKEMGGGAAFDVGIYCLAFILGINNSEIESFQHVSYIGDTGVDEIDDVIIKFKDGVIGKATMAIRCAAGDNATVFGERGKIILPHFWKCQMAELYDDKNNMIDSVDDEETNGFVYEIKKFVDAWNSNYIEVEEGNHALTIECARLIDDILSN